MKTLVRSIRSVGEKGFTLMELVIGMSVLGLLIALTVPLMMNQYQSWAAQSGAEIVTAQMQAYAGAAAQYQVANGGAKATTLAQIVTAGMIADPVPPAGAVDSTVYTISTMGGTAWVRLRIKSQALCQQINSLYNGTDSIPSFNPLSTSNVECSGPRTTVYPGEYSASGILYR